MYKMVSDWIEIEHVEDEHEESNDFKASFWYNNHRYFMEDFLKAHDNAWGSIPDAPEYIHAYESNEYYNPLFIELSESGDAVRVYMKVGDNNG